MKVSACSAADAFPVHGEIETRGKRCVDEQAADQAQPRGPIGAEVRPRRHGQDGCLIQVP